MRKIIGFFLAVILLLSVFCVFVCAQEAKFKDTSFKVNGFDNPAKIYDGNRSTYSSANTDASVLIKRDDLIASLYIEFDRLPSGYSITADGVTKECKDESFLHDYVDIKALFGSAKQSVTINFTKGTAIADVYGFSNGKLPDFVQIWESPLSNADLLLFSSHSDDEQLFFAGILPYYAIERKLAVQVAYSVQHFEANGVKNHIRPHEQLDGLWTVGIRNYPIMSDFPDVYSESKDRNTAFKQAENAFKNAGVTYDDFKNYITMVIRRCKPLVVVSHDLNGEYGHGTHVFTATALCEAIEIAKDSEQYIESAQKYGTWTVEKTYLHLYEKNPITMDWDTPLESLGGKTAFQKTQEGFGCHKSQHWTWFNGWIYGKTSAITKATQINIYSPCKFGLYNTTVGLDTIGGDFMENIKVYSVRNAEEALKKAQEVQQEQEKQREKSEDKTEKGRSKRVIITILVCLTVLLLFIFLLHVYKLNRKPR